LVGLKNSPDNLGHNAPPEQAEQAAMHNALLVGTPKMPGEPPRVQPSKKVEAHWDADGNRIEEA
jgi:hypothetical protein